jgi:hypothetical protein
MRPFSRPPKMVLRPPENLIFREAVSAGEDLPMSLQ